MKLNYKIVYLFVIIFLLLLFYYKSLWCTKKAFTVPDTLTDKSIDLVIARYNESLDWLDLIDKKILEKLNIVVYNKNPNSFFHNKVNKIINLPNIGKCDHTYLYHIISNYNKLSDVTIFLPGSANMSLKWNRTIDIINRVLETGDTVFSTVHYYDNVKKDLYNFTLEEYATTFKENVILNSEKKTKLCYIRPFGKWYEHWFDKYNEQIINYVSYGALFAVSRENIYNRSLQFYNDLIQDVSDSLNPECGHFIERAWFAIFYPVNTKNIHNIVYMKNNILLIIAICIILFCYKYFL